MLSRGIGRVALEGVDQSFKELRDTIIRSSHFYIFPYVMQGCVNITENGLKPEALYLNDYTHVSKVISGDMPLIATWEKSTRWIGKPKRYGFMQCEMGARKKYNPEWGRVFKGTIKNDQHGLSISSNKGWGTEMTELQEETQITIQTTTELDKEDIFRLYIIKRWGMLSLTCSVLCSLIYLVGKDLNMVM